MPERPLQPGCDTASHGPPAPSSTGPWRPPPRRGPATGARGSSPSSANTPGCPAHRSAPADPPGTARNPRPRQTPPADCARAAPHGAAYAETPLEPSLACLHSLVTRYYRRNHAAENKSGPVFSHGLKNLSIRARTHIMLITPAYPASANIRPGLDIMPGPSAIRTAIDVGAIPRSMRARTTITTCHYQLPFFGSKIKKRW